MNKDSSPSLEGVLDASLDQCYVEQKNGQIVRQVVGYDRFEGLFPYRQLTELYRALRVYVNCFQPSMKLQAKEREGSKVRRTYDQAQTLMQRLLASSILSPQKQQELLRITEALDPLRLLTQLEHLQKARLPARCHICLRTGCISYSASVFRAAMYRRKGSYRWASSYTSVLAQKRAQEKVSKDRATS